MKCRLLRMGDNLIVIGSDDWIVCVWFVLNGVCEVVLVCYFGVVINVEYCFVDKGIIIGKMFLVDILRRIDIIVLIF